MPAVLITVAIIAAMIAALITAAAVYYGLIDFLHTRPRPKPGQIRIACVGDSVTHGMMVAGRRNCYPAVLGRLLGKEYCVGNFGYSDRTASYSGNKPYAKEKLYARSLDFAPDIVLLMLGSNDTKVINWDSQACLEGLCALIDSYRALPSAPEVILLSPPPMFPVRRSKKEKARIMWQLDCGVLENGLIPLYRDAARIKGVRLIDTHRALAGRKYFSYDGVHPNALGAKTIAETVYRELGAGNPGPTGDKAADI